MDEILRIFEDNHIDPPQSHLLVLSLDALIIGVLVWCVLQMRASRRAAEQAKRIEKSTSTLYEGSRFVAGRVELAQGESLAIRVTITQTGTEHETSGKHTHEWTETDREVEARPFYLRCANGDRIRVEPPNDVRLVDKLDQMHWVKATRRRKRAELTSGERAIIEGVLERGADVESSKENKGYRGAAGIGWIMRPARKRGMSVSAESLSQPHEIRATEWRKAVIACAVLGSIASAFLLTYHARVIGGHNVVATYVKKSANGAQTSRGKQMSYHAHVEYADDRLGTVTEEFPIDYRQYAQLPKERRPIWLRHVRSFQSATALGRGSSVNGLLLVWAAIFGGLVTFVAINRYNVRPWYKGPVNERRDGPLPNPPNVKFIENQKVVHAEERPRPAANIVAPLEFDPEEKSE